MSSFCILVLSILFASTAIVRGQITQPIYLNSNKDAGQNQDLSTIIGAKIYKLDEVPNGVAYVSIYIDEKGNLKRAWVQGGKSQELNAISMSAARILTKWLPPLKDYSSFISSQLNIPFVFINSCNYKSSRRYSKSKKSEFDLIDFYGGNSANDFQVFDSIQGPNGQVDYFIEGSDMASQSVDYSLFKMNVPDVGVVFNMMPFEMAILDSESSNCNTEPAQKPAYQINEKTGDTLLIIDPITSYLEALLTYMNFKTNGVDMNQALEINYQRNAHQILDSAWNATCDNECTFFKSFYDLANGNEKAALSKLDGAKSGYPTNPELHYMRGICYERIQNEKKACKAYSKARQYGHAHAAKKVAEFCDD